MEYKPQSEGFFKVLYLSKPFVRHRLAHGGGGGGQSSREQGCRTGVGMEINTGVGQGVGAEGAWHRDGYRCG